jgi:hypothetical protein
MKLILFLIIVCFPILSYGGTYLVDQHFSAVSPSGWSSTSGVWTLNRNETATGNYRNVYDNTKFSSRFSSAANGNSIYLYIPINFKKDSIYLIVFYTKRVCSIEVNTNELPNQTTLLSNQTATNSNCSSNFNTWYEWSFTYNSTYTGTGYFQIWTKTIYGGPTSVYMDDVSVYESGPVNLPIELLYFKGRHTELGNLLEWETLSEHNNDYFSLYRSDFPINWAKLIEIDGSGTSSFNNYYQFLDRDNLTNVIYYYLSQTDYDGKRKEFEIISIENKVIVSELIRVTNVLGQDVEVDTPGVKFFHYSDGRIIKRY